MTAGRRGAQRSEMQMLVGQIFSSVPNSKRDVGSPEAAGRGTRTELSAMSSCVTDGPGITMGFC
jgi:hypothetical protein